MNRPADDIVPKIARTEVFYFFARVCMIMASLLGAPLAIVMLNRVVSQSDAMQATLIQQNVDLRVLSSRVDDRLNADLSKLSDHELRIRSLERAK